MAPESRHCVTSALKVSWRSRVLYESPRPNDRHANHQYEFQPSALVDSGTPAIADTSPWPDRPLHIRQGTRLPPPNPDSASSLPVTGKDQDGLRLPCPPPQIRYRQIPTADVGCHCSLKSPVPWQPQFRHRRQVWFLLPRYRHLPPQVPVPLSAYPWNNHSPVRRPYPYDLAGSSVLTAHILPLPP